MMVILLMGMAVHRTVLTRWLTVVVEIAGLIQERNVMMGI